MLADEDALARSRDVLSIGRVRVRVCAGGGVVTSRAERRQLEPGSLPRLIHDLRGAISTILMWEQVARLGGVEHHDAALAAIRACALSQAAMLDELVKLGSRGR